MKRVCEQRINKSAMETAAKIATAFKNVSCDVSTLSFFVMIDQYSKLRASQQFIAILVLM